MRCSNDQEWTTEPLKSGEAFAYWREVVHEAFLPLTIEKTCEGRFNGRLVSHAVDTIHANRVLCGRHSIDRTRANIASSKNEFFYLLCPVEGSVVVRQFGREAVVAPGECALAGSDDPFVFDFQADIETISIQIPHSLLTSRLPTIRDAAAMNFVRTASTGAALSAFAYSLPANKLRDTVPGAVGLAGALLDLIVLSARESGAGTMVEPGRRRRITSATVIRYIEAHLTDPLLSPARAAQALGVSERSVYLAMKDAGVSFVGATRSRRLERIARALETVHDDNRRIIDIALEWGFSDVSTFNRAFKERFEMSPRDYARLHRRGHADKE